MRPLRIAHLATIDLTHRHLLLGQLRRLVEEGHQVTAISAPGPWVADLRSEGIAHVAWPSITRAWNPRADARAFIELVGILRAGRYDIVHTHNPKPGVMGRIAARAVGVPVVVNTVHGFWVTPEDRPLKRSIVIALERLAARFSDLELYQSEEDLAWATALRLPARRALLGNGTSLARFDPGRVEASRASALRKELGIAPEALVVATVGRLVGEKGYRELAAAAPVVRRAVPSAVFLAIGGPDPDKADSLDPAELAAAGIHVTGWRSDVPDLLSICDVFVLPSWREGMPRSAIEAAAMGKPLVLTDIRGCREVARDGVEAIFVPSRAPDRLAEALIRILSDPVARQEMGEAARRRAVERFDEIAVADRVVAHYRELAAARVPGTDGDGREVVIRRAGKTDAPALAALHRRALPEAFLPTLGDAFMRQLYRALIADPDAVVLVASRRDRVVGFVAGVRSVRRFYRRFFVRRGAPAGLAAMPRLLDPRSLRRARETASYPSEVASLPDAELLAVAVAEDARRGSVGRRLAGRFLDLMGAAGVPALKVVVASDNAPANAFYRSLGFERATDVAVHGDRTSTVWVITCRSLSLSASAPS